MDIGRPNALLCNLWNDNKRKCEADAGLCLLLRVTFCAEHARRNAMALRAQMRKSLSSPSPEALLSQLSCYNRAETHSMDGVDSSEASRALGMSTKATPPPISRRDRC